MILIISEERDSSTNGVIKWVNHYGYKWIRINPETDIEFIDLKFSNSEDLQFRLKKNNTEWINFNDIKSVWYRRGEIKPSNLHLTGIANANFKFNQEVKIEVLSKLKREATRVMEFIYTTLAEKPSIGNFSTADVNKLVSLHNAKKVGLMIPSTLVSTNKDELIQFANTHGSLITKSLSEAIYLKIGSEYYCNYTEGLSKEFNCNLPDSFFPSLTQTKLDKAYELRIFYLHGSFYSMAIFSQADSQTSVDFRKYNDQKPNRTVPFNLPSNIAEKLNLFMRSMNLNTGSIDMIVTKNDEYIFLEVNPVGQFGMVSGPCNYNLEKEIANCLIQLSLN
jgi:ATP-GRASP peptide maturase of grasp-with-spasm system